MQTVTTSTARRISVREGRIYWVRRGVVLLLAVLAAVCAALMIRPEAQASNVDSEAEVPAEVVIVHEGESLWDIARDCAVDGDVRDVIVSIVDLNGLESSTVHPGQRLLVPTR